MKIVPPINAQKQKERIHGGLPPKGLTRRSYGTIRPTGMDLGRIADPPRLSIHNEGGHERLGRLGSDAIAEQENEGSQQATRSAGVQPGRGLLGKPRAGHVRVDPRPPVDKMFEEMAAAYGPPAAFQILDLLLHW